jgi:transposase-like protein
MSELLDPRFTDEDAAREYLEKQRWPDGPVCPRCGAVDRITKCEGEAYRAGLYNCGHCRRQFTVTVGTVYERSHIPLHKWLIATRLLCSSKKGMSSHQLHRTLGLPYKTAWFMAHRIRAAMAGAADDPGGLGGEGKVVEADETYFGNRENAEPSPQRKGRPYTKGGKSGPSGKRPVVALVERKGKARTFHVDNANAETVTKLLRENASRKSKLMTDESKLYTKVGEEYAGHGTVNHSGGEYVGFDDPEKHTNTVEGYFSIFKRGMKGIYQHCGEQHLHRYLAEFEFRYNSRIALGMDDAQRTDLALKGIEGKRLTYRRPDKAQDPQAEATPTG